MRAPETRGTHTLSGAAAAERAVALKAVIRDGRPRDVAVESAEVVGLVIGGYLRGRRQARRACVRPRAAISQRTDFSRGGHDLPG
ncbi:MAG: hypothetical protein NVS4B3_14940 [Gemmatimonadaceae bacterium]